MMFPVQDPGVAGIRRLPAKDRRRYMGNGRR